MFKITYRLRYRIEAAIWELRWSRAQNKAAAKGLEVTYGLDPKQADLRRPAKRVITFDRSASTQGENHVHI